MKTKLAIYTILIWYSALIAWLFLDLTMTGEIVIREPRIWLRTLETFLAFGILGFSIGVFVRFVKSLKRRKPTE